MLRGFTLVELMWATSVFLIASLGLAASMAQGEAIAAGPRSEMVARNAMRELVAEISAAPFHETAALFHGRAFEVPGLHAHPGDPDGLPGEIAFAYAPANGALCYAVTLTVRWRDRSGDRTTASTFWLSNVRGDVGIPPPLEALGSGGTQPPYRPAAEFAVSNADPPPVEA